MNATQGFFAYRIRLLSGRLHISLVCWGLCILRFVGGMALAAEAFLDIPREPDYFQLQDNYGWLITSALNVGVAVDLLITVSLCFYIRQLYTPYNLPKCVACHHTSWLKYLTVFKERGADSQTDCLDNP